MFKFDFDIEDEGDESTIHGAENSEQEPKAPEFDEQPFEEHSLVEMLEKLPDDISYSSVQTGDLTIPRRDLFDVRLQLLASEAQTDEPQAKSLESREDQAAEFASHPSDLVPRVYEGGMKTWECSLDLAKYVLGPSSDLKELRGKKFLELGCGTSVPTLAILQKLFNEDASSQSGFETTIHVQDYNSSVLEYVTLPNIILVWFFSNAGEEFRSTLPPPSPKQPNKSQLDVGNLTLDSVPEEDEEDEDKIDDSPPAVAQGGSSSHVFDCNVPDDLTLSASLKAAFLASLKLHRIQIRMFSGPWDRFNVQSVLSGAGPYDVVLTSETVYQPTSLPSLVRLLRDATGVGETSLCLVAAKLVYFGVGGGIREFERALSGEVEGVRENIKAVWEQREGVKRSILKVIFEP